MKYCETSLLWSSIEKPLFFGCNQRKSILFLTVHYWEGGFGGWWGDLGGRFLNIETGSPVIRLLLGWILRTFGALGGCPVPNTFNYPSFLYSPSVTLLYFNTVIRRVTAILRTVGSWGLSCAKHSAKEPSELWCTFPLKTVLSWTVFSHCNCYSWIQVKTEIPLSCIQSPLPPHCSHPTRIRTIYIWIVNCYYNSWNMLLVYTRMEKNK